MRGGGCGACFAGLCGVLRAGQAGRRRGELAGLPEGEHIRQTVDDAGQGGQNQGVQKCDRPVRAGLVGQWQGGTF